MCLEFRWYMLCASVLVSAGPVLAQRTIGLPPVSPAEFNGDLRNLHDVSSRAPGVFREALDELKPPPGTKPIRTGQATRNVQQAPMPGTIRNFAGLNGIDGGLVYPSDVNGDVGPNHYIEAINDTFGIFDKTGNRLAAFGEDALWRNVGTTPCNGHSEGDPVVLYDRLADRWFLTHFAFATDSQNHDLTPFYECFAVSKTSDPVAGGWWLYSIRMDPGGTGLPPAGTLADYPKFGIWSDGCLYMSANAYGEPAKSFTGTIAASFSRSDMESGLSVHFSMIFLSNATDPFTMIPSNLLGGSTAASLPASGTPNYFVSESQTDYFFEVRKFTPGTNCGGNGVLSAPVNVKQANYTTPNGSIVPQPNTSNKLDSLNDGLMQKVQYRKVGNAESLWVVHSVQTSASSPVMQQWAQIDVTGGTIATTPVQQQIYAPSDNLYRWMGSLAVDQAGNMALGYSTSSGAVPNFPSIAYSGRLASDPPNNLPQTEVQLVAGAASQTHLLGGKPIDRWGDYSSMSVDPTDDCTFWYANQYYASQTDGTGGNWSTRVASFKFPSCGGAGPSLPSAVGALPASGSANSQTFIFTFSAPGGYQTLSVVDMLINNALDGRHGCYVAFVPASASSGSVFLIDDAGDAGGPYQGLVLPGGGSVSNSQCTISGATSSVSGSGSTLTLILAVAFAPAFAGNKVVYTSAQDKSANGSGWQPLAVWNVPGSVVAGPAVQGATPGNSTNATQTYILTLTDTRGWQDISVVNVLVNSAIDGRHACFAAFAPSSATAGSLFLVDDAGDAGGPYAGMALPGSGTVSNSQCTISGTGSLVAGSGNTLILTLTITFNHSFTGNRVLYLAARSNTASSDWQAAASVSVP